MVLLWSLRAVGTLGNLTDLQILITEQITETFRLTEILRKDMPRAPGLLGCIHVINLSVISCVWKSNLLNLIVKTALK